MGFSRSRESEQFIVKSNQSIIVKIFSGMLTILMWIYTIVIYYTFIVGILNLNNEFIGMVKSALNITNKDIQDFCLLTILLFIIITILLSIWKTYNFRRFSKLERRRTPRKTTDEEMLNLNLISLDDFKLLSSSKVVEFEKNPINDIYNEKSKTI